MPAQYFPAQLVPDEQRNPLKQAFEMYGKGVQAKYAKPMMEAEIFHKTISPLATLASNPQLWSIMPEEQQRNIASLISRTLSASYGNGSRGSSGFGGGNYENNMPPQQQQQHGGTASDFRDRNNIPSEEDAQQPASAGRQSGLPPTPFNRSANQFNIPGTTGAANPLGISKAQQAGFETSATGQANAQTDQYKSMQDHAAQAGIGAQDNLLNLDKFKQAYDKLEPAERGSAGGKLTSLTSNADIADSASNALADSVARAQQIGHITAADRSKYDAIKVNRGMNPQAVEDGYQFISGMNIRQQERLPFIIRTQAMNLSPSESNAVWQYYIHDAPFYNTKTHKMSDKLNTYEEYLTPQKIKEALSPKARKEITLSESLPNSKNVAKELEKSPDGNVASGFVNRIPKMKSDEEFEEAFNTLNKETQAQVLKMMKGKGG